MKLEELMTLTHKWSKDRGILDVSTPARQLTKTFEEVEETMEATQNGDRPMMLDGIGDILVTLCNYCHLTDIDPEEAMQVAWDAIKDRKGMMVDGMYVKYENLKPYQRKAVDARINNLNNKNK